MKFREIEVGCVKLDVRVKNSWGAKYLAAYEPDHSRNHSAGKEVASVEIKESADVALAFDMALVELKNKVEARAENPFIDTNTTKSRRGFYETLVHMCNYREAGNADV